MESGYCLVWTLYFVGINIAVLIFTQMMINIIRFRTSIGSIESKSIDRLLRLVLEVISKIPVTIARVQMANIFVITQTAKVGVIHELPLP